MLTVRLIDGTNVEVPNGMRGMFVRNTKHAYIEEVVETTLDIMDGADYSANVIASFRSDVVIGFVVEADKVEEE